MEIWGLTVPCALLSEQEGYEGCTAEVPTKLTRFATNLNRMNISYQLSYKRALAGIDKCASTYPNKDSIDRLRSCVDSMDISYFTAANKTQKSLSPSPAMSYFQENVVKCARTAAENIATKGSQFLMKLDNCASLSGTLSAHLYKDKLVIYLLRFSFAPYNTHLRIKIHKTCG